MARARTGLHKAPAASTPRRSTRRTGALQHAEDVPSVYQELLSEAADEEARPLKKRKTQHVVGTPAPARGAVSPQTKSSEPKLNATSQAQSQQPSPPHPVPPAGSPSPNARDQRHGAQSPPRRRQTIVDSDESDDSDMEWEDALADGGDSDARNDEPEIRDISITIGAHDDIQSETKRRVRRRAITAVDKKRRLDIHKWHIMCLLYHVHRRNAWCNDRIVQATVRNTLSAKVLANLVPDPNISQFQASKQFLAGIGDLKLLWSKRFTATAQGMYKPRWADTDAEIRPSSDFDELDDPMDLDDFRTAASKLEGSQDVGAQLFCALIRGVGLEARLVCSLQCLPFASAAQPSTPQKSDTTKNTIVLDPYNTQNPSPPKPKAAASSRKPKSRLERVLGERHPALSGVAPKQRKKYHTAYPVYWVEVFNSIHQKWVPVDPLSTFTINQPEKLEPPLNSSQNTLTYAIAFEDDYTAKDVTRRYTKAYNAKTRKFRVESTQRGQSWWQQVMSFWKRREELDRDQVEDAALARKEAAEGIPKAVQDFKHHPVYVLERHLRHNEVIFPLKQVGKVNVGSSFNPKMEPIYRRKDVHLVRSADKWYRLGKDVQDREQPLKHAKPKKSQRISIGPDTTAEDQEDDVGVGLYAEYQTSIYIPPPVVRGRVPRNAYGNLDLYVPSMCPPGGLHIRHKLASKAARIIGVDYAEAVTGFKFKGRHGTAVVQGVVVAQEYARAVEAVIDGMEYSVELAEEQNRITEALRLWRRFFLGLKIVQRINGHSYGGETRKVNVQNEVEQEDRQLKEEAFAGGFFPDEGESMDPPVRRYEPPMQDEDYAGGFDRGFDREEDGDASGSFVPDDTESQPRQLEREESQNFGSAILSQQQLLPRRQSSFLVLEDGDDYGGGFLRDSSPPPRASKSTRIPDQEDGLVQHSDPVDLGGGFLPDVHLERPEVDLLSRKTELQPVEPDVYTESDKPGKTLLEENGLQSVDDETGLTTKTAEPSLPSSSPSDAGSLPLEDPADEDAEPDWLMDAT